jgi:non-ribosomal peptide synthetase component F
MLVNTLPIRTRLDESADMAEIVTAVNRSARAAFAAVDIPYADLVNAVHGGRRPDADLVEVLFQLQEDPLAGVGLEDLEVSRLALDPGRAMFPLQVSVRDAGDHLHITFEITAERFSDAAAQRLLDDYIAALESLAALAP